MVFFVYPVKLICEDDPPEANLIDLLEENGGVIDALKNLREFGTEMHELEKSRNASGRESLTLGKHRSHTAAIKMAEQVADFSGLQLFDLGGL